MGRGSTVFSFCAVALCVFALSDALNLAKTTNCGTSGREGKIVGGHSVRRGTHPSIVSLKIPSSDRHFCGGTLISEKYVLTAAHCVPNSLAKKLVVVAREHNQKGQETPQNAISIKPDLIIRHADYSDSTFLNDIALIRLREPLILEDEDYAGAACLPDNNEDQFVGENAIAAGWGRTKENGKSPALLQSVEVPVLENSKCKSLLSEYFDIKGGQICAGVMSGGKDACQGDSGGPLYIQQNGKDYVVGVVSIGVGCARPRLPGVYTRTSHYLDWIQRNMK